MAEHIQGIVDSYVAEQTAHHTLTAQEAAACRNKHEDALFQFYGIIAGWPKSQVSFSYEAQGSQSRRFLNEWSRTISLGEHSFPLFEEGRAHIVARLGRKYPEGSTFPHAYMAAIYAVHPGIEYPEEADLGGPYTPHVGTESILAGFPASPTHAYERRVEDFAGLIGDIHAAVMQPARQASRDS